MKLIKINTEHYIEVDDSEINEGDWAYSFDNKLILQANKGSTNTINSKSFNGKGFAKITRSTQILGFLNESGITTANLKPDWNNVKPLPLSEVKELIGEVDVEKKAEEMFPYKETRTDFATEECRKIYKIGYNQALEDNKEKKYTEEDIQWALYEARHHQEHSIDEIIQALQPKTEWEVEFDENGKLRLV